MPIYEYVCTINNHVFEELQKISDPPIDKCIFCESPVTKVVSKSSFHLKGSGWYLTDYKNKNSTSSAPAVSSTTAKTEEKPEPQKTDKETPVVKPETKSS